MKVALFSFITYLVSSIPFGYIVFYIKRKDDIRKYGSGNIGATNVLRTLGKVEGVITGFLDAGKALIPILVAKSYLDERGVLIVWLFAVLGHIFPLYLRFRGGKGVSTAVGGALIVDWRVFFVFLFVFVVVVFIGRMVSLSSLSASLTLPFSMYYFNRDVYYFVLPFIITVLIFIRHSSNIKRILNGEENRI